MRNTRFIVMASVMAAAALSWGLYHILATSSDETESYTQTAAQDVAPPAPAAPAAVAAPESPAQVADSVQRQPVAAPPVEEPVAEAPHAPLPNPVLVLLSTVVEPNCCRAVFRTASGKIIIAGIGERVEGALVVAVTESSAILQTGADVQTLTALTAAAPAPMAAPVADASAGASVTAAVSVDATRQPPFVRSRRAAFPEVLKARARFLQGIQSPDPASVENPPVENP